MCVLDAAAIARDLGDAGIAGGNGDDRAATRRVALHLNELEATHDFVLLVADDAPTAWTERCCRGADEILLFADAAAPPALHAIETDILMRRAGRSEAAEVLVLLHPLQTKCPARHAPLARAPARSADHLHLRPDLDADLARLARIESHTAVGLVFAGGGARGLAHLGVYRALRERGVEVDYVGGTSIGAIMAALVASDAPVATVIDIARRSFSTNPTGDFNLVPLLSLIKGRRLRRVIHRALKELFGFEPDIEDLWKNYYCVASNYSQASESLIRGGNLGRAMRASIAIPGALPPVVHDGDLLCDGGTFNNFPVDVMRRMRGVGTVVGVDLNTRKPRRIERRGGAGDVVAAARPPASLRQAALPVPVARRLSHERADPVQHVAPAARAQADRPLLQSRRSSASACCNGTASTRSSGRATRTGWRCWTRGTLPARSRRRSPHESRLRHPAEDRMTDNPLVRVLRGLLDRAGPGGGVATVRKPDAAPLSPQLAPHAHKVTTAEEAVARIPKGSHVFVGTASATPRALVGALETMAEPPADIELVHFITTGAVPHDAQGRATTRFRHRSFFVGTDMRSAVREGMAEYVPMSVARLPELIRIGRVRVDVALVQVSPPDEFGYVSLGVSVDVLPAAIEHAQLVIAEVNAHMPRSMGDSMVHVGEIDWLVASDSPLAEFVHPATEEHVVEQIARYIGGIIEDGSTLQIGLGRVTNAALKYLTDRRDLGIHSDVITDAIIPLLERGILTGARKSSQRGKIVTSFAIGNKRLYDLIDRNPLFSFLPIDVVSHPSTIAAQHRMVSVTQAFAVDLTGQVCVDQLDGEFYGGIAAQGEFLRGASRSEGGKAIICLASTTDDGGQSRVRAMLGAGEGVTIARTDVHFVVTEFGIAHLFGKSIRERAIALIEVAHPKFRVALFEEAKRLGYVPESQTLQNMRAYPVEEEVTVTLKDGRRVLLRPAVSSDGPGIRDLFHTMSESDVYTRFFRKVRELSGQDVQRLCNVNFENEVALVAATGARESPEIVAQSCYFIDPSTNLAETAFMVSPGWQGCGLGAALQRRMIEHAKARGIRGFVADILSTNVNMVRLANAGTSNVTVESEGETVRVTALF